MGRETSEFYTKGDNMKGLTRWQFRCGTIMEGILNDLEEEINFSHCPTKCECCRKQHGPELFKILKRNVAL